MEFFAPLGNFFFRKIGHYLVQNYFKLRYGYSLGFSNTRSVPTLKESCGEKIPVKIPVAHDFSLVGCCKFIEETYIVF